MDKSDSDDLKDQLLDEANQLSDAEDVAGEEVSGEEAVGAEEGGGFIAGEETGKIYWSSRNPMKPGFYFMRYVSSPSEIYVIFVRISKGVRPSSGLKADPKQWAGPISLPLDR